MSGRSTRSLDVMRAIVERIRSWFRDSSRVHLREAGPSDLRSMVNLIDRFIDGPMKYPLEWDDFISCEHTIPAVERYRDRVAALEPLLFSKAAGDKQLFISKLLTIRNEAAAVVGLPGREDDV